MSELLGFQASQKNQVTVFDPQASRLWNMSRVNAGHSKNTSQHTSTDIIRVASEVLDSTRDYLPDKICRYLCVEENSMTVFYGIVRNILPAS